VGYTDKALMAHLKSVLHAGLYGYADKIADINESDVVVHYLSLTQLGMPDNVVALLLSATRLSGTGTLYVWPMDGVYQLEVSPAAHNPQVLCCIANKRLKYHQTVANDDFDLFCTGYFTEGRLSG